MGRRSFGTKERKGPVDEEELLEKPWLDDTMDRRQVKDELAKSLGPGALAIDGKDGKDLKDNDFMKSE